MDYASPADDGSAVSDYNDPEWMAAKKGLVNYRRALIFQIIFSIIAGVVGVGIGMSGVSGGSVEGILTFAFIVALIGAVLTAWMVYGLGLFAKVPEATGGRGLATAAMVFAGIGLLVQLYATYQLSRLAFGGGVGMQELIEMGESNWTTLSRLGSLIGFICLLVALRRVAVHVGAYHVRDMIGSFVVIVIIIIGLALLTALVPLAPIVLLGGLALLVLAIVALVKFLRIIAALGNAIGGLDVSKVFD